MNRLADFVVNQRIQIATPNGRRDQRINDSDTFKTSVRLPSRLHRDPNSSVLAKDATIIAAFTYRY